jgi:hypothetical protein
MKKKGRVIEEESGGEERGRRPWKSGVPNNCPPYSRDFLPPTNKPIYLTTHIILFFVLK